MFFTLKDLWQISLWLTGYTLAQGECRLWLAPSYTSTDKVTKYGIFAGVSYQENESLPMAEIGIPLIDMIGDYNRKTRQKDRIVEFLESHLWTSEYAGTGWEGNHSAPLLIPGIGVLPQFHRGISNVNFLQEGVLLRERPRTPIPGTPHPSRGAITPYYNITLKATRNIPAGMELFADFGDVWDGNSTSHEIHDTISRQDYEIADKLIHQLMDLYNDFPSLPIEAIDDIMDYFLQEVLGIAATKHAKIIRSLIPDNPRRLRRVIDGGGSFMYRYTDMVHSKEWFSKNGYCLDSLRIGQSTIPYAGRGAFANHQFAEGDIISLSPMIHIADKSLLDMYTLENFVDPNTGERFRDFLTEAGPIGKQLLLNYCFGHPESSMLLFPMAGHVGLINHHKQPNAYITWSRVRDKGLSNQHAFHDVSVAEMAEVARIVVVMKVVALREIEEGEEVTISYGDDWQRAWNSHMVAWESSKAESQYLIRAQDLREVHKNTPLKTPEAMFTNPYPDNVATVCFLNTKRRLDGLPQIEGGIEITEFSLPADGPLYEGRRMVLVDILERQETGENSFYNYTVMVRFPSGEQYKVLKVPHAACIFVDKPYTSDIHTPGAFRQPIGISHRDFPQAWRNLR